MPPCGHLDRKQRSEVKRRACDTATTEDQSYLAHRRERSKRSTEVSLTTNDRSSALPQKPVPYAGGLSP
jgi:hypothetical protein